MPVADGVEPAMACFLLNASHVVAASSALEASGKVSKTSVADILHHQCMIVLVLQMSSSLCNAAPQDFNATTLQCCMHGDDMHMQTGFSA